MDVNAVNQVPGFIEHARHTYTGASFELATLTSGHKWRTPILPQFTRHDNL